MNRSLVMLALAALLLVAVTSLVGCAKKPADTGPVAVQPSEPGDIPDAPAPADTPAKPKAKKPTPKNPKSMADIIDAVALPDSYQATMTMKDGSTVVQLVVTRDNKPRKMVTEARGMKTYMDLDEGAMYILPEGQKTATKMLMSEDTQSNITGNIDAFRDTTEVTGSETVNGVDCWVVAIKEGGPGGGGGNTWLAKDTGLTQRMTSAAGDMSVPYDRINDIEESEVTLPDGIEVNEMKMPEVPATN